MYKLKIYLNKLSFIIGEFFNKIMYRFGYVRKDDCESYND